MDDLSPTVRTLRNALMWLVMVTLVLIGYLVFRAYVEFERGTPAIDPRPITPRGELAGDEKATIDLFNQSAPSVVFITRLGARYNLRMQPYEVPEGTGSGFVWDDAGHVVT